MRSIQSRKWGAGLLVWQWGAILFLGLFFWSENLWGGPWQSHQDNIQSIESRIAQIEEELEKTAGVLRNTQQPEEVQALMRHMLELREEMAIEKSKLHEEVMHTRFRHPEQGQEIQTQYRREPAMVSPPSEQPTAELDAVLDQVRWTMEAQYGVHRLERIRAREKVQNHFLIPKKDDREKERIVLRK